MNRRGRQFFRGGYNRGGHARGGYQDGGQSRGNQDGGQSRSNQDGSQSHGNQDGVQSRGNHDGGQSRNNHDGGQPRGNNDGGQFRGNPTNGAQSRGNQTREPSRPKNQISSNDIEDLRLMVAKLNVELDTVRSRVVVLEAALSRPSNDETVRLYQLKSRFDELEASLSRPTNNDVASREETDPEKRKNKLPLSSRKKGSKWADTKKRRNKTKRTYPELSEQELDEVVQDLKREFLNNERPTKEIKRTLNSRGPKVSQELVSNILDHAIVDVTSPTKLSKIAENLYQILVSYDNSKEVDFRQSFYDALNDISKREQEIAIDAPRFLDTLGQILAECIIPMQSSRHRILIKSFLNKCLDSYCKQSREVLLANVMKSIAAVKSERFAKEIWDTANLNWDKILAEGTNLDEFLQNHDVKFTTQEFPPEPKKLNRTPKELEKFADDVTDLVEKDCTPQALEKLVQELNIEPEERVEYLGTYIYAIVRGCLSTDSGDYKLNNDALNKYSSILNVKNEDQDAIALHALTALTKLWHQYNCPQDLLRLIHLALHNHGTVSYEALNTWLNDDHLLNIPGIGAARLNSQRYIEDLGANLKS